jgi:hypothetical protein
MFFSWQRKWFSFVRRSFGRSRPATSRRLMQFQPVIDQLEDRTVLATFTVPVDDVSATGDISS